MTNDQGASGDFYTAHPKRRASTTLGWIFVFIFAANLIAGWAYFFTGSPFSIGEKYQSELSMPDLTVFPHSFSAAYPYPPAILNFEEISGNDGIAKFEWKRINYLAQIDGKTLNGAAETGAIPSIGQIKDSSSLRPDAMKLLSGKAHDDPVVFKVLSRRLAHLKSGWIAEVSVAERTLNLYQPVAQQSVADTLGDSKFSPVIAPPLPQGVTPDIVIKLSRFYSDFEFPLMIAAGISAPILVVGSHGTLLKLDESGKLLAKTRLSGDWTPAGGIIHGRTIVGMDIVSIFRRIITIIFLALPLLAYLSFAYAFDLKPSN